MDNTVLTFDPVMFSDNGPYQCVASNPLSHVASNIFMLDVFYGPKMPMITGPKMAKAGDNVTLSCSASSNPLSVYKWFFNDSLVANTSEYVTPPLTMSMSGMYTCVAFNNITGKNSTAYTMLAVDPIVDAQIVAPMIPAIEGQFYNLTCNVTGPAEHVYWMKNSEPLQEDNTTAFYMDNRTVTFNPLQRNNTGSYECTAINTVWKMSSPPHELIVNFGPLTPVIDGPAFAETGRTAVFSCSAMSMPPSQFSWWFNGSEVANTSVFTTDPLSVNMSGEYACMAYNYLTGMNSTSSKMLTIIEAIESVMISNSTIPINNENLTLTCEITGPYEEMYWMKDDGMFYHAGNITLNFTPLGLHPSPKYILRVNYGPLSVNISGSDSAKVGVPVTMTCSAESQPDCDFNWFHNYQSSPVMAGSVLTFLATKEKEGKYTCMARNPVTNITMYATTAFALDHASALHIPSQAGLMLMGLFALSVTVLFN
ncbi:Protein sax-3 Sensory axon guidance 3 Precursor [Larimichthys crocea]|uniref:Protein sax-3 Sensory axon guidance 3 n=1 Tax=Larimichthys crocea TaxID=215358 RepID=A0A6G0IC64_LARCR|nr:Protein sax-3 Sensory axon guidance 3 Precursor [Larimichthys crocea]